MKNENANTKQFAKKYASTVVDQLNSDEGKKSFEKFCLHYYEQNPGTEITEQKVLEIRELWVKYFWLILVTDKESPIKDEFYKAVWEDLRADD